MCHHGHWGIHFILICCFLCRITLRSIAFCRSLHVNSLHCLNYFLFGFDFPSYFLVFFLNSNISLALFCFTISNCLLHSLSSFSSCLCLLLFLQPGRLSSCGSLSSSFCFLLFPQSCCFSFCGCLSCCLSLFFQSCSLSCLRCFGCCFCFFCSLCSSCGSLSCSFSFLLFFQPR